MKCTGSPVNNMAGMDEKERSQLKGREEIKP
jgi:hypothetical protein